MARGWIDWMGKTDRLNLDGDRNLLQYEAVDLSVLLHHAGHLHKPLHRHLPLHPDDLIDQVS